MVSRFACGMSQQTKSTFPSIRLAISATSRAKRSSFAMTSFALCFLQATKALASSGRSFRLPLSTSTNSPQSSRSMACQLHAAAQEANGAAAEAQGCVPPPPIATSGSGRAVDQPDTTRLGELLCGGAFQRVLQLHQRLGGKEGSAPHAARSETKGLRLDAME